jgi:hypothetical protein
VDAALLESFGLDPDVLHPNHGAFGVAPVAVRRVAAAWRDRAERNPHRFNRVGLPPLIASARERVAGFLGIDPSRAAWVRNVSEGRITSPTATVIPVAAVAAAVAGPEPARCRGDADRAQLAASGRLRRIVRLPGHVGLRRLAGSVAAAPYNTPDCHRRHRSASNSRPVRHQPPIIGSGRSAGTSGSPPWAVHSERSRRPSFSWSCPARQRIWPATPEDLQLERAAAWAHSAPVAPSMQVAAGSTAPPAHSRTDPSWPG